MSQQFDQNPIKFECDIKDGRGLQQYWYTPINKCLYIEPDGVNNQNVNGVAPGQPHASGIPGMIEIGPDTQDENHRYIYNATRHFREHFDIEFAGGASELPSSNGAAPPEKEKDIKQPEMQVSADPISQETREYGDEPTEMLAQLDVREFARKEFGTLIEVQSLIIDAYSEIFRTKLDPDDDSHTLIEMMQKRAEKLKGEYYGESE